MSALLLRLVVASVVICCALTAGVSAQLGGRETPPVPVWQVKEPSRGRPVTVGGRAYFLTPAHEVVAVDMTSGAIAWRAVTTMQSTSTEGSRLSVAGGSIVAGDYDLFAFDPVTGAKRWTFAPVEGYGPGYYLGEGDGETVVAGSPSGRVYAVDAGSGKQRWSTLLSAEARTTAFAPVISEDVVVAAYTRFAASAQGGLIGLSYADGRIVWQFPFPSTGDQNRVTNFAGGPAAANGMVVAASGDGNIWAVHAGSGRVAWRVAHPLADSDAAHEPLSDYRALAVDSSTVVATSLTGIVVGLSLETGRELWRRNYSPLDVSALELAGSTGMVAVPSFAGTLSVLLSRDGELLWRIPAESGGFRSAPVFMGDLLFAGGSSGMWAFPLRP